MYDVGSRREDAYPEPIRSPTPYILWSYPYNLHPTSYFLLPDPTQEPCSQIAVSVYISDKVGKVGKQSGLGEFEQLVLLSIMQLKDKATAPDIARILEEKARRDVSRGALYSSLDRLEKKRFLTWGVEELSSGERGHARRLFKVTDSGQEALRLYRAALLELWQGLEEVW